MTSSQIDRRTLAKGAAWMAPAITIAAAAPSLAASSTPTEYSLSGSANKCPGQSDVPGGFPKHGYRLELHVSPEPASLVVTSVLTGNGKQADVVHGPNKIAPGVWEAIIDASSSPRTLIVTVSADGTLLTSSIAARPHCS